MKKKLLSCVAAGAIMLTLLPSALADNSEYVGRYYSGNTDGTGYAEMQIVSCSDTSIVMTFKRIKNDVETYTYTFDEGQVSGNKAIVPCHMVNNINNSSFDGKAMLELGGNVKIQIVSSLNTEMYTGTLPKVDSGIGAQPGTTPSPTPGTTQTPAPANTEKADVQLNGTKLSFDAGAEPVIINDRTYVPLRSVFSNMGINVYWDEYSKNSMLNEQLITCTKNDTIIQFARTFNSNGYNMWTLNKWESGNTMANLASAIDISDLQPRLIESRSYVPLRVISETFGAQVDWDGETNTVLIECDPSNSHKHSAEIVASLEDFNADIAKTFITDEYSSTVSDPTPYFDNETKFYVFDAVDQWGKVRLRVSHGGFLEALPTEPEKEPDPEAAAAPSEEPTEEPDAIIDDPTEEPAEAGGSEAADDEGQVME